MPGPSRAAVALALASAWAASGGSPAQVSAPAGAPVRPAAAPASVLAVEPPLIDFGRVSPGSRHPARFLLRNLSGGPVTVARATPSCKCTDLSDVVGKTIAPGAAIELTATLAVPGSPGQKDAEVLIALQGVPGVARARMQADVTMPVRVEPAYVDALKGAQEGEIRVASVDGAPFRITAAGGKVPSFVGFDPAADALRAEYRIRWRTQDLGAPAIPQWWVIDTDRADCPQVPLRIRHETTGSRFDPGRTARFWFVPESIVLAGRVRPGTPIELRTTIEHLNPAAQGRVTNPAWSQVRGMSVPGGEGTAELVSATPRGESFVDLVFRFTAAPGRQGPMYVPVMIETATGQGPVFVAATVGP
jgi:hypothetical protein